MKHICKLPKTYNTDTTMYTSPHTPIYTLSVGLCVQPFGSGVLTVAPCACCVSLYVCMYKVSILGVFEYFLSLYHFVSILLSFLFLIFNKSYFLSLRSMYNTDTTVYRSPHTSAYIHLNLLSLRSMDNTDTTV